MFDYGTIVNAFHELRTRTRGSLLNNKKTLNFCKISLDKTYYLFYKNSKDIFRVTFESGEESLINKTYFITTQKPVKSFVLKIHTQDITGEVLFDTLDSSSKVEKINEEEILLNELNSQLIKSYFTDINYDLNSSNKYLFKIDISNDIKNGILLLENGSKLTLRFHQKNMYGEINIKEVILSDYLLIDNTVYTNNPLPLRNFITQFNTYLVQNVKNETDSIKNKLNSLIYDLDRTLRKSSIEKIQNIEFEIQTKVKEWISELK